MKFIDLFSGIGGFRLGLEMAGHECVGHVEIDKYANKSYAAMHNPKEGEFFGTDIRTVEPWDLPEADIYCGGFPCQSFSVAGKRGGFEDTRGTLFFEVMRLARERKPEYLFLENVAGLLSHDGGNTFWTILNTIRESGYDVEYQVLNSKNFGVPQNRERVFIIGHLRTAGRSRREVFPIRGYDKTIIKNGEITSSAPREFGFSNICGALQARDYKDPKWVKQYTQELHQIGRLDIPGRHESATRVYGIDGIGPALNTCGGGGLETKIAIPVLTPNRPEKRQNGRRFKEDGEDMFTLTGQDRHGVMIKEATKQGYAVAEEGDSINLALPDSETRRGRVGKGIANTLDTSCNQGVMIPSGIYTKVSNEFQRGPLQGLSGTLKAKCNDAGVTDGFRIRRLTPKECFRLQGYPDEYFERAKWYSIEESWMMFQELPEKRKHNKKPTRQFTDGERIERMSDSQLYKQAGNSVTVNVIYEIAKRLKE